MNFIFDALVFFGFIACVLFVGFYKSRKKAGDSEQGAEDYFLAGRGLSWWLIGFSLIAANISAEQFVGMSGQGAGLEGISCASWEWIAAITLVVVAFCMLPYFLKTGITTMPEFLEVRYNHVARTLMTVSMIGILIVASLIGVTYAGSLVMWQLFNSFNVEINFTTCCVIMSVIAGAYVLFGGLKACAWADLIQGAALIVGGGVIAYFAIKYLGETPASELVGFGGATTEATGVLERFNDLNASKMHMGRPATDAAMPWTILLMGIWIPNFYYWGLNQYITQRILGSGSLAEGQKGIVFAAALKLIIPFIIVIPGIIAFNLCAPKMAEDTAKTILEKVNNGAYKADELILFYSLSADDDTAVQTDMALTKAVGPEIAAKVMAHNAPIFAKIADTLACTPAELVPAKIRDAAAKGKAGEITLADNTAIKVVDNTYKYDGALGHLMNMLPKNKGILGFVLAALLGAIVSSLAAVLNATSTLFTMDIFQRYIKPDAKPGTLVLTGRVVTVILAVLGCIVAAGLKSESIFKYIQEIQCYVSPGIFAVFAFGMLNRSAGRWAGVCGLIFAPVVFYFLNTYGWDCFPACILGWLSSIEWLGIPAAGGSMHYLIAASYTLVLTLIFMLVYSLIFRLPDTEKVEFKSNTTLDMTMSKSALIFGVVV
ncbi:MAG: sodium/solute symporter, partial [Kiritimatiellae bacterium]|nr:sodium/solute symporter [Kiritimatiellia bacterium]